MLITLLASCSGFARETRDPIALEQRLLDGGILCAGCATGMDVVDITATSSADACSIAGVEYTLRLELRTVSELFTGVATHASTPMVKAPCTSAVYPPIRVTGLVPDASYHWQVMEETAGSSSAYTMFEDGGIAFIASFTEGLTQDGGAQRSDAGVQGPGGGSQSSDGGDAATAGATHYQVGCSVGAGPPAGLLFVVLIFAAASFSIRRSPKANASLGQRAET